MLGVGGTDMTTHHRCRPFLDTTARPLSSSLGHGQSPRCLIARFTLLTSPVQAHRRLKVFFFFFVAVFVISPRFVKRRGGAMKSFCQGVCCMLPELGHGSAELRMRRRPDQRVGMGVGMGDDEGERCRSEEG